MYTAEPNDPRDDYASSGVPSDIVEFLSPFSKSYDARRSLGLFAPLEESNLALAVAEQDNVSGLSGMGFTIPIIGVDTDDIGDIGRAVDWVGDFFGGGGSPADPASAVWKNIKPSDVLTLSTLHVRAKADGWYDAVTDRKLTTEDSDFRSGSLMASLIDARVPGPKQSWVDTRTGQKLSNTEAWNRWLQDYGAGATLESVLRNAGVTIDPVFDVPTIDYTPAVPAVPSWPIPYTPAPAPAPSWPTYPGTNIPMPQPGGAQPLPTVTVTGTKPKPTGTPTTASAAGFSISPNVLLIGGAALALAIAAAATRTRK